MHRHPSELVNILYPLDVLNFLNQKKYVLKTLKRLKLQNLFDLLFFLSLGQIIHKTTFPPFAELYPNGLFFKYCLRRISAALTTYLFRPFSSILCQTFTIVGISFVSVAPFDSYFFYVYNICSQICKNRSINHP